MKRFVSFNIRPFAQLKIVGQAINFFSGLREDLFDILNESRRKDLHAKKEKKISFADYPKLRKRSIAAILFLAHLLFSIEANEPSRGFDEWEVGKHGQYLGYPRNYYAPLSPSEISDIRFIVLSLANKPLVSLLANKKHVEDAGDRVDHVHPLKFFLLIFTDEELKVAIRNMRTRGWVWDNFIGGMSDSFEAETAHDNMKVEFLVDFASTAAVDVNLLYPSVRERRWEAFVDLLIKQVPRKGDYDRYDS